MVLIHLPPLRERPGDIPLLVRHFLQDLSRRHRKTVDGLTPEALDALVAHRWPGNVRELRNVIEQMVVLARGSRLTVRDLPAALREGSSPNNGPGLAHAGLTLRDSERLMIVGALQAHNGSRTLAARQLGISRRTLHRKLNEYGLQAPRAAEDETSKTRKREGK